ncbi:hypothetical protein NL676_008530 [Syzygium grande]|nr:hypothetical protein NL676_008530 [Syzygium grande]
MPLLRGENAEKLREVNGQTASCSSCRVFESRCVSLFLFSPRGVVWGRTGGGDVARARAIHARNRSGTNGQTDECL